MTDETTKEVATVNLDGWNNILTWRGQNGKDRTTGNVFVDNIALTDQHLSAMYRANGISKRIVDLIPNEMTREWIQVEGDDDNYIIPKLEELDAKKKIRSALKWARLYGGAVIVMGIDDSQTEEKRLNEFNVRDVVSLHVFEKQTVQWLESDLYKDLSNPKYGQPEFYTIQPTGMNSFKVHETRVIRLIGEEMPDSIQSLNRGWGDSVLNACFNEMKNLGASYSATANILEDFIQTVLKIQGLSDQVAAGNDAYVKARLNIIDLSRSVTNTIILDSLEEYDKSASSVSGLDTLIEKFCLALASVTGIPYAILMGQSPAGMQATGDADIRMFYDMVRSQQDDNLKPMLERLIKLLFLSKKSPYKAEPEAWKICFNPLWQLSEVEEANYRKTIAETDVMYINTGVLDPIEVGTSRFGSGSFNPETTIDMVAREELEPGDDDSSESGGINGYSTNATTDKNQALNF